MAQTSNDEIKPLKIGDKVPEAIWHMPMQVVNHPEGKQTITLNDYKGKLIILDFWATWCSSCLSGFSKLEALQKEFGDKIQILLVNATYTQDDRAKVMEQLTGTRQPFKAFGLPSVVNEAALYKLFPNRTIPQYIWIDAKGQARAQTSAEFVNAHTIGLMLSDND